MAAEFCTDSTSEPGVIASESLQTSTRVSGKTTLSKRKSTGRQDYSHEGES